MYICDVTLYKLKFQYIFSVEHQKYNTTDQEIFGQTNLFLEI